jgi:hypothetical protein
MTFTRGLGFARRFDLTTAVAVMVMMVILMLVMMLTMLLVMMAIAILATHVDTP